MFPVIGTIPNSGKLKKGFILSQNIGSLAILYNNEIVAIPGATFRFLRIGQCAAARRHSYSTVSPSATNNLVPLLS